jgi:hypothetical protein
LTFIFPLVNFEKFRRKFEAFKRWISADCVESFKKDSTQSANIHLSKVLIVLYDFTGSASANIDVNKFFKKI